MYIDPDWANCVLAMHMDSSFADEKGHTVTAGGSAAIGTTKKFGTGGGNVSSSTTGGTDVTGLLVTGATDIQLGSGDFTFEAWVYPTFVNDAQQKIVLDFGGSAAGSITLTLSAWTSTTWRPHVLIANTAVLSASVYPSINQWSHIAVTRSAGVIRLFLNGTVHTSTYANTTNYTLPSGWVGIGKSAFSSDTGVTRFIGHMDEVYVYKGVAKYTTSFTVPSEPRGVVDRKVSGFVKDISTAPLARIVRAYARDTGEFAGETISSAVDGSYTIEMLVRSEVTVVCLDDTAGTTENDIAIRSTPVVL